MKAPDHALPAVGRFAKGRGGLDARWRALTARIAPRHGALAGILALSAVLNVYRLSQNGWANTYYSAAVKSMLGSLHNFFFVAFDPGALVSVDKPPIALWVQAASAKVFGFDSMSVLLPNAIAGVLAVAVLYRIVRPRFGTTAALVGALALAGFPSVVAVSRDNNPDAILVLLMVLACGAALRAVETGRLRSLAWCAVLVGLAFNTKMLAAYLVVPGIAIAYLLCAPGPVRRRLLQLAASGLVLVAVSGAWLAAVDLTPASQRPWVGSTRTNSELGLALNYNGLGRVAGQQGGPGQIGRAGGPGGRNGIPPGGPIGPGAGAPPGAARGSQAPGAAPGQRPTGAGQGLQLAPPGGAPGGPPPGFAQGRPFGGPPGAGRFGPPGRGGPGGGAFGGRSGPLRLFSSGLGGQGAWLIPLALLGGLGIALRLRRSRRDPRLAALIVLGGWFLTEAVVISFANGIVHPYYVSAMAPGLAAMVGAGAVALAALARRGGWRLALPVAAGGATLAAQLVLLHQESYLGWYVPVLIAGIAAATVAMVLRRRRAPIAMAAIVGLLLVAPTAFSSTTWSSPVSGTFPAAGARQGPDRGPLGPPGGRDGRSSSTKLASFLRSHAPHTKFQLLTQSSMTASSLIVDGLRVGSMGGFNGDDPALDARGLARLLERGQARYVEVGGAFPGRGGNSATAAVQKVCTKVPSGQYQGSALARQSSAAGGRPGLGRGPFGAQTLYDCGASSARIAALAS